MRRGRGQDVERRVDRETDDDHVADGADAGPLAERHPEQQYESADADDDPAELQAGPAGDALVQHVPRIEAEPGADHQRHADPEQDQAGVEIDQASQV